MRSRLATQIRKTNDICLFCALRLSRDTPSPLRTTQRIVSHPYTTASSKRTPAGAAVALKQDDEDEFPLLKENAAAEASWTRSRPSLRGASLPGAPRPTENQNSHAQRNSQNRGDGQPQWRIDRNPPRERQPYRPNNRFDRQPGHATEGSDATQNNLAEGGFRIRKSFVGIGETLENARTDTARKPFAKREWQSEQQSETRPRTRTQTHQQSRPSERRLDLSQLSDEPAAPETSNVKDVAPKPKPTEKAPEPSVGVFRTMFSLSDPEPTIKQPRVLGEIPPQRTRDTQAAAENAAGDASDEEMVPIPAWKIRFSSRFADDVDSPVEQQPARTGREGRRYRSQSGALDLEMLEAEQALNGEAPRRKKKVKKVEAAASKPALQIPDFISVQHLAQAMKIKVDDLVNKLEDEGFEGARYDHMLDAETSIMFADMYGFETITAEPELQDLAARPQPEDISTLPPRPPIVTIMGHVDHGKTTILDWLRKSSVAAGEHGGITQHIGAFSVTMPGSERQITFLDTPGHEAFLDMRRRGANVTDIVVLVVAADDSVKPQTIEAIKHALEAQVQIVVAINKVDKHDANIEQVKQDLVRHDIVVEDFGGDFQAIPVSGKTGQGMAELEEAIITLADVLDLRAEQDGPAEGQIIESKVTNAGRVATVLVKRGVLRVGDFIVAGPTWGRVRTLRNDAGVLVTEAFPGDPVQVDGWRGEDPTAGLEVIQADNEQHAKDVIELRQERAIISHQAAEITTINKVRSQEAEARAKVLAWERENKINRRRHENEGWVDNEVSSGPKEVHFVVKADVAGSVEAIVAAVSAIGNHEIRANVIHSGTGPVVESDIHMLATSGELAFAINFNQPVDPAMASLAQAANLEILNHNIIYKVTDVVKQKVEDALPPLLTQRVLGEAEVGKVFQVTVKKDKIQIAGCKVTNGTISRANKVRILRSGEVIYTGTLESLKNVKRDVNEMRKGTECGMAFKEFEDVFEGDQVQCFEEKEEKRKLY